MKKAPFTNLFWTLNILFLIEWVALAFNVPDRKTWMIENALTLIFLPSIIHYYRKDAFSKASYILIFIFLVIHTYGAHYTYGKVPYEAITTSWFGTSLNTMMGWERNHYDRLVHFMFGFLLVLPLVDIFTLRSPLKRWWLMTYVLLLIAAASTTYELIEWGAAEYFGGDTGSAYLGAQGDEWDAQKDILFASIGSIFGLVLLPLRRKEH